MNVPKTVTLAIGQPGKDNGITLHRNISEAEAARLIRAIPKWQPKPDKPSYPMWVYEVWDEQGIVVLVERGQ